MSEPEDDLWAGERVARWLRQAEGLERQLAPVSEVLFAAAALQPGERVLDVGCGSGPTTREAATLVGATGAVTGLDISGAMLDAAATVPVADGAAPIDWMVADPVTWSPTVTFDAVISRFGVMFFSDPPAAFAHLAAAARSEGRLALAVWQPRAESPLFEVPLQAVLDVRRAHGLDAPEELANDLGGASSLGDPAVSIALLEDAGWVGAGATPHHLALPFGGGLAPVEAAEAAADFGPTRLAMEGLEGDVRAEAVAAIVDAFAGHVDDTGHVVLGGSILILTATRP